jgi:hypothetical protein
MQDVDKEKVREQQHACRTVALVQSAHLHLSIIMQCMVRSVRQAAQQQQLTCPTVSIQLQVKRIVYEMSKVCVSLACHALQVPLQCQVTWRC